MEIDKKGFEASFKSMDTEEAIYGPYFLNV